MDVHGMIVHRSCLPPFLPLDRFTPAPIHSDIMDDGVSTTTERK